MNTVKLLLRSIRENKRNSVLSIIFVGIEVICECALPFVMAKLIDASGVDWQEIILYGGNTRIARHRLARRTERRNSFQSRRFRLR